MIALLLPLALSGLPGLHAHGFGGPEQELLSLDHESGSGTGCSLCALHRKLGQSIPGKVAEAILGRVDIGPVFVEPFRLSRPVTVYSDPRAPPVCDSNRNV